MSESNLTTTEEESAIKALKLTTIEEEPFYDRRCESCMWEKLESNIIELENFKITVAEAEAHTVMLMKYEHKKGIERDK